MPRPKKVEDETKKQISKDIGSLIYYFYTKHKGTKPDVSMYKSNYKIIEPLMKNDDPDIRTYSISDLKYVLDFLVENDIAVFGFTILLWPDLVRAIVDGDKQATRYALQRLSSSQHNLGFYGKKSLGDDPPPGW